MKKSLISVLSILLLCSYTTVVFGAITTTQSSSSSRWSGMLRAAELNMELRKSVIFETLEHERRIWAMREQEFFGNSLAETYREKTYSPNRRDVMAFTATSARLYFDYLVGDASGRAITLALFSRNRGPISLSNSETDGASGNVGSLSTSSSTTTTTCEENLKWKGYQINCQNGIGSGTKDGVTFEFINWKPIKAEGVSGPVRWSYQAGVVMVEHRAKGTVVSFDIRGDDIKVISAENMISYKRDSAAGNALDSVSQNMTQNYVDLVWRDWVDLANNNGQMVSGEWWPAWARSYAPLHFMLNFVDSIATAPDVFKKLLEAKADLTSDQLAKFREGLEPTDFSRNWLVLKNGSSIPYDPLAVFNENSQSNIPRPMRR